MLSVQWVTVIQKICPTDGLWVSWPAQLVRILLFALRYVCIIRFSFLYIFTSVSAAYMEVANLVEGMQYHL